MLAAFRSGDLNCLVATDVLQEARHLACPEAAYLKLRPPCMLPESIL